MRLSIIIPVFNEDKTITELIQDIQSVDVPLEKEIIVVDDGSRDTTPKRIQNIPGLKILTHKYNRGKGAAVKTGLSAATGDIVLIQDADREYDPHDYPKLLRPILNGRADVVFGSRFRGDYQRVLYFWHYLGNSFLTFLSNLCTNLNLSDMETGYKVFSRAVVDSIKHTLRSQRFGIEPELTARVARKGWRVYEVPINYSGRTYKEGKKIHWVDGVYAICAIIYFNVFDRS